jgi:hypothetical protein
MIVIVLFQNHMPSEPNDIQQQQQLRSNLVGTALRAVSAEMRITSCGFFVIDFSPRRLGIGVLEIPARRQTGLSRFLRSYRQARPHITPVLSSRC